MTVETRYMRGDQHTVNTITAYILGTTQSNISRSVSDDIGTNTSISYGIRVYKVESDGTETEITAGTPVAVVTAKAPFDGIKSATWDCPSTSLNDTDAIKVEVWRKFGTVAWKRRVTFITEQLGAASLDAATWTVYYYIKVYFDEYAFTHYGEFWWGTSTYNSRIETSAGLRLLRRQ